jgi:hypothetical protein
MSIAHWYIDLMEYDGKTGGKQPWNKVANELNHQMKSIMNYHELHYTNKGRILRSGPFLAGDEIQRKLEKQVEKKEK